MSIELRLGPEDLTRIRFAISPAYETVAAVRTLVTPGRRAMHVPWMRRVLDDAQRLDLRPFAALMPVHGYVPDFLTPPSISPVSEIGPELARIRSTPPEQVAKELRWSIGERETDASAAVRTLLGDPEAARDLLADLVERCWTVLVAPFWDQIRDLLDADIRYRARRLTDAGLDALFADLHPDVTWRPGRLVVRKRHTEVRDLRGEGLVVMPSAFNWPDVTVILSQPWQPTVIYPARGIAEVWQTPVVSPAEALSELLGRTRAALLLTVVHMSTTTRLATRIGMSNATVSEHLRALHRGGLVASHRVGREVWYEITPVGQAVVTAASRRAIDASDIGPHPAGKPLTT